MNTLYKATLVLTLVLGFAITNAMAFSTLNRLQNEQVGVPTDTICMNDETPFYGDGSYMTFIGDDPALLVCENRLIAPNDGTFENGYMNFQGKDLTLDLARLLTGEPIGVGK